MSFQITVYIDNGGPAGHMYVGLTANGVEAQYGFGPADTDNWVTYSGKGIVHNNETATRNAELTNKVTIELSQSQYNAAKSKATQIQTNPGKYNGLEGDGNNCVSFTNAVAKAAGISEGVGNLFSDDQLNISYAGWYADAIYGDGTLFSADQLVMIPKIALLLGVTAIGVAGLGGFPAAAALGAGIGAAFATYFTPIALDLSGNSRIDLLSSTTASNKVFFDIDNDGFQEKTSWITGGDGWLAMDNFKLNATNDNFVIDKRKIVG